MRGLLIVARRQAASLRRSLPDSPLRGLYGALPWASASQLACALCLGASRSGNDLHGSKGLSSSRMVNLRMPNFYVGTLTPLQKYRCEGHLSNLLCISALGKSLAT